MFDFVTPCSAEIDWFELQSQRTNSVRRHDPSIDWSGWFDVPINHVTIPGGP